MTLFSLQVAYSVTKLDERQSVSWHLTKTVTVVQSTVTETKDVAHFTSEMEAKLFQAYLQQLETHEHGKPHEHPDLTAGPD